MIGKKVYNSFDYRIHSNIEKTLDFFKITKGRAILAETLLRLDLMVNKTGICIGKDAKSKALFSMYNYFKSLDKKPFYELVDSNKVSKFRICYNFYNSQSV